MQLALLGVGGAGGRVVDAVQRHVADTQSFVAGACTFDIDGRALQTLSLPDDVCHLVEVESASSADDVDSGPSAESIRQVATDEADVLRRQADEAAPSSADGIMLVAGVGGATAAGVTPVLAKAIREVHDVPLYTLTILPEKRGADGYPSVVSETMRELEGVVDAQLVFDNGTIGPVEEQPPTPESAADAYTETNTTIATWTTALFGAGEGTDQGQVGESVVDASEIIATLGTDGYAVVGSTSQQVREPASLLDRLLSRSESVDEIESYNTIETAVRRSLFRHRSADVDLLNAERALLVTAGPPAWLNRKAIADARGTITRETGSGLVRGGDAPDPDGTHVTVTVLCAGLRRETVFGR